MAEQRGIQMEIREETRRGVLLLTASGRVDSSSAGELEAVLPPARTFSDGRSA